MPNHVRNVIIVGGGHINEVLEFMGSGDKEDDDERIFDFEKLIPMPDELRVTSGSLGSMGKRYLEGDNNALDSLPEESKNEAIELGQSYIDNIAKHGHDSWYSWSIDKWGTKWNCYDVIIEGDQIEFNTAWAHPFPILEALSEKFPHIEFEVKYADEDTGYNVGHYSIQDGEVLEDNSPDNGSNEAYELAFELNGGSEYYRIGENGTYEYYDADEEEEEVESENNG